MEHINPWASAWKHHHTQRFQMLFWNKVLFFKKKLNKLSKSPPVTVWHLPDFLKPWRFTFRIPHHIYSFYIDWLWRILIPDFHLSPLWPFVFHFLTAARQYGEDGVSNQIFTRRGCHLPHTRQLFMHGLWSRPNYILQYLLSLIKWLLFSFIPGLPVSVCWKNISIAIARTSFKAAGLGVAWKWIGGGQVRKGKCECENGFLEVATFI